MIIRRRTYLKTFTDKYGYFMRNITPAGDGGQIPSSGFEGSDTEILEYKLRQNIYTRCMQKETPVGSFPPANRINDRVSYNSSNQMAFAHGYNNGQDIIVVTGKRIYKSTNGGVSFSAIATLPSYSYWYRSFQPIPWMDSNYYYVVYCVKSQASYSVGSTVTMYVYRCSKTGSGGSSTSIYSNYVYGRRTNSSEAVDVFTNCYGCQYNFAVSPKGQICYMDVNADYDGTYDYFRVLDIPNMKYSARIAIKGSEGSSLLIGSCGQWINDNTTYGKWFLNSNQVIHGQNYYQGKAYYTITGQAISYNGQSLTLTDISAKLATIKNDYENTQTIKAAPVIETGSCLWTYINKIFIYASGGGGEGAFWLSDTSFNNIIKITDWSSRMNQFFYKTSTTLNTVIMWGCGLAISPDGKYGLYLSSYGNLVFDLSIPAFISGNNLAIQEELAEEALGGQYRDEFTGFMLPRTAK